MPDREILNFPSYWFRSEPDIAKPSLTPVFGDCVTWSVLPLSTNSPARDLYSDLTSSPGQTAIARYTIARHGARGTAQRSMSVQPGEPLGSWVNNLVLYDGHVAGVKLDRLWEYYWHKQWEPPATRPR